MLHFGRRLTNGLVTEIIRIHPRHLAIAFCVAAVVLAVKITPQAFGATNLIIPLGGFVAGPSQLFPEEGAWIPSQVPRDHPQLESSSNGNST